MFTHQVIDKLTGEGLPATTAKIRYAMLTGAVKKPATNAVGFLVYDETHVEQFRKYLQTPRRRGRPSRLERLATS